MPRPLTALALTPGVSATAADLKQYDRWIWLNNESPYDLVVSTSTGAEQLPAMCGDRYSLTASYGNPALIIMPSTLLNLVNPPAASVTGTIYLESEAALVPQKGIVPLVRQVGANVVTTFPAVVQKTLYQHITTTISTTILAYTIPSRGTFRLNAGFNYGNPSSENVHFFWNWTDINGVPGNINYFYLAGAGILSGGTSVGGGLGETSLAPQVFEAGAGVLTVSYQDPAGTPNDFVTVILEQLA